MQITITADQLRKMNACGSGVETFVRLHGESWTVDWTKEAQLELIKSDLRRNFGWAVCRGLLPVWCLRGSDLRGSDLSYSNLRGSDLSGSDLRYSDLRGSDLSYSNLSYSDLRYSDLRGSNLRGSDLSGARRDILPPDGWQIVDGFLQQIKPKENVNVVSGAEVHTSSNAV